MDGGRLTAVGARYSTRVPRLPVALPALLLACAPAAPARPSVLLVTLDTTRADRLSPYGYAAADTPAYDRLAAQGAVYERAYATCPLTIPSHASILTGLAPPTHGVRDNGDFVLGENHVTLAERLQAAGYATAAFTSAFPTQARWGFDQGFDAYHDPRDRPPTVTDYSGFRSAGEVVDDAVSTLSALDDGAPIFAWVHLFDAHWPYAPPEPFASAHPDPYDGEIAYAAHEVGRLLEWWDATQGEGSIVVVTSDHGEAFGEGGEQTHGYLLHDGTIRAPLLVRGPGVAPGSREDAVVSHLDLVPTVLSMAGLALHDGLQGRDLRKGGSGVAWSESLLGQYSLGLAALTATTQQPGRFTRGARDTTAAFAGGRVETVPSTRLDAETMAATHAAAEAAFTPGAAPSSGLDAETQQQLLSLGYLGGDPGAESGDVDPRDVIHLVPLTWQVRQAVAGGNVAAARRLLAPLQLGLGDSPGVVQLEMLLLRAEGALPEAYEMGVGLYLEHATVEQAVELADLALALGRLDDGAGWVDDALALQPNSPEALGLAVSVALAQGDAPHAAALARRTLAHYPDHTQVTLLLAQLELTEGRLERAHRLARRAVDERPRSAQAWATYATVLWELGESDAAIAALDDALVFDRVDLMLRMRRAEYHLAVGRNVEARKGARLLAHFLPDEPAVEALLEQTEAAVAAELARP